jgi:hypothetical protein
LSIVWAHVLILCQPPSPFVYKKGESFVITHYHCTPFYLCIVFEDSCREQDARVHEETLGEDKKRKRDILVVIGEITLV